MHSRGISRLEATTARAHNPFPHSAHAPCSSTTNPSAPWLTVVDARIPFTTYLQNLSQTLREAAKERGLTIPQPTDCSGQGQGHGRSTENEKLSPITIEGRTSPFVEVGVEILQGSEVVKRENRDTSENVNHSDAQISVPKQIRQRDTSATFGAQSDIFNMNLKNYKQETDKAWTLSDTVLHTKSDLNLDSSRNSTYGEENLTEKALSEHSDASGSQGLDEEKHWTNNRIEDAHSSIAKYPHSTSRSLPGLIIPRAYELSTDRRLELPLSAPAFSLSPLSASSPSSSSSLHSTFPFHFRLSQCQQQQQQQQQHQHYPTHHYSSLSLQQPQLLRLHQNYNPHHQQHHVLQQQHPLKRLSPDRGSVDKGTFGFHSENLSALSVLGQHLHQAEQRRHHQDQQQSPYHEEMKQKHLNLQPSRTLLYDESLCQTPSSFGIDGPSGILSAMLRQTVQPGALNVSHNSRVTHSPVATDILTGLKEEVKPMLHPVFLGLNSMSLRRASADKPAPVKKYKCDVCQKAFSRSNTLVTHKRIHTGDKPFKCEVCGRAFRQPGNLTRHRLTHTTHKPYVCQVCNKAFNRASNLNTHIRTHSSLRSLACTACPKTFLHKPHLAAHVFTHTAPESRPYPPTVPLDSSLMSL